MNRVLPPGRYSAADLAPGDRIDCGTTPITADEIDGFASLTGDRFAIHISDTAAREHGFERRVAHGLLVMACAEALIGKAPAQIVSTSERSRDWRFLKPILADDEIAVTLVVIEVSAPSEDTQLHVCINVRDQRGDLAQTGEILLSAADGGSPSP